VPRQQPGQVVKMLSFEGAAEVALGRPARLLASGHDAGPSLSYKIYGRSIVS